MKELFIKFLCAQGIYFEYMKKCADRNIDFDKFLETNSPDSWMRKMYSQQGAFMNKYVYVLHEKWRSKLRKENNKLRISRTLKRRKNEFKRKSNDC